MSALAADVNARIRGTVTDPAGAFIPNAQVEATNEKTGVKFQTRSLSNGDYLFPQLPIGVYSISATAPGFKTFAVSGITLNIDQQYVQLVKLDVGNTSDTVSVEADGVQVNLTEMQLSNVVDSKQIVGYPLIGRSFVQLEQVLPGVQASSDRFTSNFSVNGSQSQQSSYLLNGADINDFALNTIGVLPNVDAIDQFNLITGPLNAEYSRNSGAIVSAVVKQGSNQFHGSAFEFYRDTFLNNGNFFNYSATTGQKTRPKYHQNLFGGTLGGPIIHDKLFFFAAYQGNRAKSPQTSQNVVVPTSNQRTGNYSGTTLSNNFIPGTISIPGCVSAVGGLTAGADTFRTCSARLGGNIPVGAFNSISANLLNTYVPLPNTGTNRYAFTPKQTVIQDQAIARVDFNPTTRDTISFIGLYQHAPTVDDIPFSGATLPGFGDQNTSETRQMTAQYTRQLSSSALNQFALHYTRFNFGSVVPQNVVAPSSLGFSINPQNTAGQSVPYISLVGGFQLGFSTNGPQPRIDQTYQVDDSFSKTIGHHQLKFGYDGRRFNVDNQFAARNNGSFSFTSVQSNNSNTSGNVFLDFELGIPGSYSQSAGGRISVVSYENYVFAQDSWRAAQNFTVNYGLGWQTDSAIHNRQYGGFGVQCFIPGQQSVIFSTAPKSLSFPGDPGCNDGQGSKTQYKNFGPRLGFAWAPNLGFLSDGDSQKFSISGGFGIYFNRTEEEGSLQNLSQQPFGINSNGIRDSNTLTTTRPAFANPYQNIRTGATIANPFPAAFPKPGDMNVAFSTNPLEISQYSPNYRPPYGELFQLSVQRELPGKTLAIVSYVGALYRHNQNTIEGNPVTQAGHDACLADAACVANATAQEVLYPAHTLYPQAILPTTGATQFGSDGLIATQASSSYHALQLSTKKAESHGLAWQISYTYSHSLDDASSFEGAGFGGQRGYNQYNKALNYGNSDFDTRHRLVLAPIYEIPYHSGGGPLSFRNLLGSGWAVSTITTFATGHPFDISYQGGESYALYCSSDYFYYTCPDVPNQIAPIVMSNPHNTSGSTAKGQFFSADSFADETVGSFGNISRNKYYAPGIDRTDGQISKNFHFSGSDLSKVVELRMEFYNLFNHTNFNAPNGNPDNGPSVFGVITTAGTGRQIQLAGKIYF